MKRTPTLLVAMVLAGMALSSSPAGAYLLEDPEVVVSEAGSEDVPVLSYDAGRSEFLLVYWSSTGGTIRGQRLSSTGDVVGSPFTIGTCDCSYGEATVAFSETSDVHLVAWHRNTGTAALQDVVGIRVRGGESATYGSQIAIATGPGSQKYPDVAWNSARDEFFVVWNSADTNRAFGRLVAPDGDMGSPFGISTGTGNTPEVAFEPIGDTYLAQWTVGGGANPYRAQRVSGVGVLLGSPFTLTDPTSIPPDARTDLAFGAGPGTFLSVYPLGDGLSSRRVAALAGTGTGGGELIGAEKVVGRAGADPRPTIAYAGDPIGRWAVVWDHGTSHPETIRGAWIGSDGSRLYGDFPVVRGANPGGVAVSVATFGADRPLVVWADAPLGMQDLYGRALMERVGADVDGWTDQHEYFVTSVFGGTWNAIAAWPETASDPALYLYSDPVFSDAWFESSDVEPAGGTELVVVDGTRTGSTDVYATVDYDAFGGHTHRLQRGVAFVLLTPGSDFTTSLGEEESIVQVYALDAVGGQELEVNVVPGLGLDVGVAVFDSSSSNFTWRQDRGEALADADGAGVGVAERVVFVAPDTDRLGVAVWLVSGSGDYDIRVDSFVALFADDFETADTCEWSGSVGAPAC